MEKALRKYLRPWGALRPASRVLVPISEPMILHSMVLASLIVKAKRGFGSHVLVVFFDFMKEGVVEKLVENLIGFIGGHGGWSVVRAEISLSPSFQQLDFFDLLRVNRRLAVEASRRLGARFALLPLTRTSLLLLLSEAIARRSCDNLLDLMQEYRVDGVTLINALYSIEEEAVVSYAYLSGILEAIETLGLHPPKYLHLSRAMAEALRGGPDLEFSSESIHAELAGVCISRYGYGKACSYCGAPSRESVCETCSRASLAVNLEKVYERV
ncbi:MAG: hypothetical protein QXK97_05710 [Acidilobaceae archaeon]